MSCYILLPAKRCGNPSKRSYTHLKGNVRENNKHTNAEQYETIQGDVYIQNYDFKIYAQHYPKLRDLIQLSSTYPY